MFDPLLFFFNGTLCAAALGVAAFVNPGRKAAVTLAALLCANFMFCNLAYTTYAPKYLFLSWGLPVSSKDLWLIADTLYGASAVLVGFYRKWAWVLWLTSVTQVGLHAGYQLDLFNEYAYTDRLQNVLHAQIAVFFVIGGPGAVDYLRGRLVRFSRRRGLLGLLSRDTKAKS